MEKNRILILGSMVGLLISLGLLAGCAPSGEGGGFDYTLIIFLVLIFGVFYFLMIRPQSKRQKEHQRFLEELKVGDKVITAGGIFGEVENVGGDSVVLKVESGASIRVAKNSVYGRQVG